MSLVNWIREELQKVDHSAKALRRFGCTVGVAFLLLGILLIARHRSAGALLSLFGAALLLGAFVAPQLLARFHFTWTAVSLVIGFFMTHVILAVVFFLVVTPIGLLQRMFGKSPIELAFRDGSRSYWEPKSAVRTAADYERQF